MGPHDRVPCFCSGGLVLAKIRRLRPAYAIAAAAKALPRLLRGHQLVTLDYPVTPRARYGYGRPPHAGLQALIARGDDQYRALLGRFVDLRDDFARIPGHAPEDDISPRWNNRYLPALDGMAIYAFIAIQRPKLFLEIGSGNSTKFARRAISDHGTGTRILSIDPRPRAEVDALCDEVVRRPLEDCDFSIFDRVGPGDVVFFDGSHRAFMNSDVTAFFLDVLPRLPSGTLVHVHDICLPDDYPAYLNDAYWSEQYLLATHLLAAGASTEIVFPAWYVSGVPALHGLLAPIWAGVELGGADRHGCSFWLRKRA